MSTEPTSAGLLGIHALTALHPGAGTALGTVDLPVQRERHTGWPTIAGSALKGILRDTCREQVKTKSYPTDELHDDGKIKRTRRDQANADDVITQLFGPPQGSSGENAGAVSVTDARLLAYPVRSLKGVFAWITCPTVMERFARDVGMTKLVGVPALDKLKLAVPLTAMLPPGCPCAIDGKHILLEEFKLDVVAGDPTAWATSVANLLLPKVENHPHYADTVKRFEKQLVVVHDDDFTHFVKYATEVTARIGLDYETKTVKSGALFYQEFLPTESLFYSVVIVNAARTRREKKDDPAVEGSTLMRNLGDRIAAIPNGVLQIGGDETTGKGFCSVRLTTGGVK